MGKVSNPERSRFRDPPEGLGGKGLQPHDLARFIRCGRFHTQFPDNTDDPFHQLNIVRQHTPFVIEIVLQTHAHMSAEQQGLQRSVQLGRGRLRSR